MSDYSLTQDKTWMLKKVPFVSPSLSHGALDSIKRWQKCKGKINKICGQYIFIIQTTEDLFCSLEGK